MSFWIMNISKLLDFLFFYGSVLSTLGCLGTTLMIHLLSLLLRVISSYPPYIWHLFLYIMTKLGSCKSPLMAISAIVYLSTPKPVQN